METLILGVFLEPGVLALVATIGGCNLANGYEYSNGMRTGMINKVSRKGLFWKTYEGQMAGQMALEGIVSGGQSMGANVWDFSIDDQARNGEDIDGLTKVLQENLEAGNKVKVKYREVLWGWPWRGSTEHYIQSVEPVLNK